MITRCLLFHMEQPVGVFDYIRCQMPLPDHPTPPQTEWMQTKDMPAQFLERYTITPEGRLIYHEVARERVEDPCSLLGFYLKAVSEKNIEVNYHGDVHFYISEMCEHWRYVARFTEGVCTRVWLDSHSCSKV